MAGAASREGGRDLREGRGQRAVFVVFFLDISKLLGLDLGIWVSEWAPSKSGPDVVILLPRILCLPNGTTTEKRFCGILKRRPGRDAVLFAFLEGPFIEEHTRAPIEAHHKNTFKA